MSEDQVDVLITIKQAATMLGIGENTLRKGIREERVALELVRPVKPPKATKKGKKSKPPVRVRLSDVNKIIGGQA